MIWQFETFTQEIFKAKGSNSQHSEKLYIHIAVAISYSEEVKHIASSYWLNP